MKNSSLLNQKEIEKLESDVKQVAFRILNPNIDEAIRLIECGKLLGYFESFRSLKFPLWQQWYQDKNIRKAMEFTAKSRHIFIVAVEPKYRKLAGYKS